MMKNTRLTLWLLLVSQLIFLLVGVLEPPTSWLILLLRVGLPLILVVYIGLMLAGYIPSKRK